MENIQVPQYQFSPAEHTSDYVNLKFKKPKPLTIIIGAVVILMLIALFLAKGLFIAAMVNGSPISRLSVIKELEKQRGKQVLKGMIDQKLIEDELNKQKISVAQEEIEEEIKKIEAQVASQGGTLKDILAAQGMTREKLGEQITIQKRLEKLFAGKTTASDAEIDAYMKDNKVIPPKGVKIEDFRKQLSDQIKQQKFQQEAQKLISDLTANAKIKYYVTY